MKTRPDRVRWMRQGGGILFAVFLAAASQLPAQDIPVADTGDAMEDVLAKLGRPRGRIASGNVTTFYYDRGTVEFVDGRVTKAFLMTPEEARLQVEEREKADAERRQKEDAARRMLSEDGARELARLQGDAIFAGRPAADRLSFWQDFARRYPYTDAGDELAKARAEVESDARKAEKETEVRKWKDRIEAIEARFVKLDADYAASLTHWKRNEINAERAKLEAEKKEIQARLGTSDPS